MIYEACETLRAAEESERMRLGLWADRIEQDEAYGG